MSISVLYQYYIMSHNMDSWNRQYANIRQTIMYMLNMIPNSRNRDLYMIVMKHINKHLYLTYNNIQQSKYKLLIFYWFVWDPSWSLHPCGENHSLSLLTWMEELLCSERIYPFLHSCREEKILIFSVHKLALYTPLFLTRWILLEKIGKCIKTPPSGLKQNDHGHEIVLNRIKDGMLSLLSILLEVDSRFIGGMILYHFGYITIKIMLFKNIQHPCLPCVEVGSTFKVVFWPSRDWWHSCNIFPNSSRYT